MVYDIRRVRVVDSQNTEKRFLAVRTVPAVVTIASSVGDEAGSVSGTVCRASGDALLVGVVFQRITDDLFEKTGLATAVGRCHAFPVRTPFAERFADASIAYAR